VGDHFNPFARPHGFPCASQAAESCEVGDLSGKYGGGMAAELASKRYVALRVLFFLFSLILLGGGGTTGDGKRKRKCFDCWQKRTAKIREGWVCRS
jgi:hypothetical protein